MRLAHTAAIVFWILLGACGVWAGGQLDIGTLSAPQAGLMPALAGGLLVLFGAVALVQKVAPPPALRQSLAGPTVAVVLLAVYAAVFERLGFVPSTFVLAVVLARLLGKVGWAGAVALGAALSGASYAVFKLGLGVPLP